MNLAKSGGMRYSYLAEITNIEKKLNTMETDVDIPKTAVIKGASFS